MENLWSVTNNEAGNKSFYVRKSFGANERLYEFDLMNFKVTVLEYVPVLRGYMLQSEPFKTASMVRDHDFLRAYVKTIVYTWLEGLEQGPFTEYERLVLGEVFDEPEKVFNYEDMVLKLNAIVDRSFSVNDLDDYDVNYVIKDELSNILDSSVSRFELCSGPYDITVYFQDKPVKMVSFVRVTDTSNRHMNMEIMKGCQHAYPKMLFLLNELVSDMGVPEQKMSELLFRLQMHFGEVTEQSYKEISFRERVFNLQKYFGRTIEINGTSDVMNDILFEFNTEEGKCEVWPLRDVIYEYGILSEKTDLAAFETICQRIVEEGFERFLIKTEGAIYNPTEIFESPSMQILEDQDAIAAMIESCSSFKLYHNGEFALVNLSEVEMLPSFVSYIFDGAKLVFKIGNRNYVMDARYDELDAGNGQAEFVIFDFNKARVLTQQDLDSLLQTAGGRIEYLRQELSC